MQQAGISISGLVLNRLTQRTRGYDYYYHNSYYRTQELGDSTQPSVFTHDERSIRTLS
jgi:hypothetical protein